MSIQSARSSTDAVVVKLGGSLLDLPDLMDRLKSLAEQLLPAPVLLISGGGVAAEFVRSLDQRFGLTSEQAHWTAIAAMSFNASLLERLNSEFRVVTDRADAEAVWSAGRIAVLDALAFLRSQEESRLCEKGEGTIVAVRSANQACVRRSVRGANNDSAVDFERLPPSWDVTSDSIAAWIAAQWRLSELVIAKSCDPVSPCIATLIENGMLDAFFRSVPRTMKIQWLNLRKSPLSLIPLNDNNRPSP